MFTTIFFNLKNLKYLFYLSGSYKFRLPPSFAFGLEVPYLAGIYWMPVKLCELIGIITIALSFFFTNDFVYVTMLKQHFKYIEIC